MYKANTGPPPLRPRPVRCLVSAEVLLKSAWKSSSPHQQFQQDDRGPMLVTSQEIKHFHKLLELVEIKEFLSRDLCGTHADNYLLAIVFIYFKRASLQMAEYCPRYFWAALYLAHDQEEEEDQFKWEILPWALGPNWNEKKYSFYDFKFSFWKRMNYRSAVSRRQCDQIMNLSKGSSIWSRIRRESHGGAIRQMEGETFLPSGPHNPPNKCHRCPRQFYYVSQELDEENFPIFGSQNSQELNNQLSQDVFHSYGNSEAEMLEAAKDTKRILLTCTDSEVSLLKETLCNGLRIANTGKDDEEESMFLSDVSQDSHKENDMIGSQNKKSFYIDFGIPTTDNTFATGFDKLQKEEEEIFLSDDEVSFFSN